MVRMPAFGLDGPWRDRPGFAQTMEQVTGLAWLTGHVDDQPRIQRGPCDPNGGLHAVVRRAGRARGARPHGRRVAGRVADVRGRAQRRGRADRRVDEYGNASVARRGTAARGPRRRACTRPTRRSAGWPCRWRPTSSGRRSSTCSDVPTGRSTPRWRPSPAGAPRHDLLDEKLGAWAAETDLDKAVDVLIAAGVPAAPAVDARRTSEHPQYVARGYYEYPDHPVIGVRGHPSVPFRFAGVDHWVRSAGADARPAQPRDPHRPRPHRGGDRRARGRRPHRDPTHRSVRGHPSEEHSPKGTHDRSVRPRRRHRRRHPSHRAARHVDRARARGDARPGATHRAHRRPRRLDGGRRAHRPARLLLHGRLRRRHAGVDPRDLRRDRPGDVRRRRAACASSTSRASTPRCSTPTWAASGTATSSASATPSWSRSACAPTTTSSPTGAAWTPTACRRSPRCRSGTSTSRSPRCAAASSSATARSTSATSPRTTASRRSPTRTGTRSGRPRQEAGISVSFHVGGGSMGTQFEDTAGMGWMTNFAKVSSLIFMDNMRCIADLIFGGVCHRFPDLKLVSVGVGRRLAPRRARDLRLAVAQRRRARRAPRVRPPAERVLPAPDLRLLLVRGAGRPRRHRAVPRQHPVRDRLPAPDVPAPRSADARRSARATTPQQLLGGLPDDVVRKVLHDNAAAVYGL